MSILDEFKKTSLRDVMTETNMEITAENEALLNKMEEYAEFGTIEGKEVVIEKNSEEFDYDCEVKAKEEDYPETPIENDGELGLFLPDSVPFYDSKDLIIVKEYDYKPVLIRAFCPECEEEIICKGPAMYNPFSFEKMVHHRCKCGWKGRLDNAYPRIVLLNTKTNEEVEVYTK